VTAVPELVERVVAALGRLAALGETIEEEWTYVQDLQAVWTARLRVVAAAERPAASHPPAHPPASHPPASHPPMGELEAAVDRLVAEADLITDPHRAIDWLSTLSQVTLVALGEDAW
jgi:hypothetical protein